MQLLKWPKSKTLATPHFGEDVEQQKVSYIAVGNQNAMATLEVSLADSYKSKHFLTM